MAVEDLEIELARAIEGRAGWTLWGTVAVYQPPAASAQVQVRAVADSRARERFRAIVYNATGAVERNRPAGTAVEAIRWAESLDLGGG